MKVVVPPHAAGFKSGKLFLNMKESFFEVTGESVEPEGDIAIVLPSHIVYIKLDPAPSFSTLELSTLNYFGPYGGPKELVLNHLFGKYDGLITVLKNSVKFSKTKGRYTFELGGFVYHTGTYDEVSSVSLAINYLRNNVGQINSSFEFAFEPKTFFADGAIERFLNELNLIFNESNFKKRAADNDVYTMALVNRDSGDGVRRVDGGGIMAINMSSRRHAVFFAAKRFPAGYVAFESSGSEFSNAVLDRYITNATVETVSNIKEMEGLADKYGLSFTEKTVDVVTTNIFDNIVAMFAPFESVRYVFIVSSLEEGTAVIRLDALDRKYTIYSVEEASDIINSTVGTTVLSSGEYAPVMITNNGSIPSSIDKECDIAFSFGDFSGTFDSSRNIAYFIDGNAMAPDYMFEAIRHNV